MPQQPVIAVLTPQVVGCTLAHDGNMLRQILVQPRGKKKREKRENNHCKLPVRDPVRRRLTRGKHCLMLDIEILTGKHLLPRL